MIFSVFQKNRVFGYSWSTHRCYYPHRSRDALSPVCGIFEPKTSRTTHILSPTPWIHGPFDLRNQPSESWILKLPDIVRHFNSSDPDTIDLLGSLLHNATNTTSQCCQANGSNNSALAQKSETVVGESLLISTCPSPREPWRRRRRPPARPGPR